ncbi:alcohol dehydrogenase catalytic domain-containing protein [Streptomyces yokosukanensis]|uniref:alcohol dehydrogenase catalytic domain-containing protein n=1 Tax=Streptomyces yokosukanensis TaxID=67386 RepID=UPI003CC6AC29
MHNSKRTGPAIRTGGRTDQLTARPVPHVPGMDVAGVVDELGPGTDGRLTVGDHAIAYVMPFGPHGSTYTEQLLVHQASVVPAPARPPSPRPPRYRSTRSPRGRPSTRSLWPPARRSSSQELRERSAATRSRRRRRTA